MEIKQVILIRKDLNMSRGKIASQASHSCMKVFFDSLTSIFTGTSTDTWYVTDSELRGWEIPAKKYFQEYIEGAFKKIVLAVNSEKELLDLYNLSLQKKIHCSLIKDSTLNEYTAVAIGPWNETEIDEITKDLKLL